MLSDLLHVSLKKYLAPLEEDHANSLLAAFVEANEDFFKSDLDINVIFSFTLAIPPIAGSTRHLRRR